jgi:deoxyribonuclease-4
VIEAMPAGSRAIIENSCEGTEIVKELPHLGQLLRDVEAPPQQLGVLIDTCHLHAAGFDLAGPDAGDRLAGALDAAGALDRIVAFHLNDCQVECGGGSTVTPYREPTAADCCRSSITRLLPMILELSIEAPRR